MKAKSVLCDMTGEKVGVGTYGTKRKTRIERKGEELDGKLKGP